jgi:hypothetical protein
MATLKICRVGSETEKEKSKKKWKKITTSTKLDIAWSHVLPRNKGQPWGLKYHHES